MYSYYKSLWRLSAINYRMLLSIPGLNPPPSVARVNQTLGRNEQLKNYFGEFKSAELTVLKAPLAMSPKI